ncbi:molybdopterin oxidoreductase [Cellulomonas sp. URHB0016]
MADRHPVRVPRRHHVEWWVLSAWASIAMLVVVGVMAAAGIV